MKLLITGGAGFIGSHFIRYMMNQYLKYHIVNYDALTYAGNLENLKDLENSSRYQLVKGDITDRAQVERIVSGSGHENGPVDMIIHFAAESHVDKAISDPGVFVSTNILGTQTLLDAALKYKVKRFLQISTDEVYGSLGAKGYFTEESPLCPSSPYSASKAAADLLVQSYHKTYGLPILITRCSNNYGPYQFPEKLIPLMITNAMQGESLPVYGDGQNIRDWLHVEDHCHAIDLVLHHGQIGEVYNIGGSNEHRNIDLVMSILSLLNRTEELIRFVDDRPGHDQRYAIDPSKIRRELSWAPKKYWNAGLKETVNWYIKNENWWKRVKDGSYLLYFQQQYGKRPGL